MSGVLQIQPWVVRSRPQLFQMRNLEPEVGIRSAAYDAEIADDGLAVYTLTGKTAHTVAAYQNGMMRRNGKQWLVLSVDGVLSKGSFTFNLRQITTRLSLKVSDTVIRVETETQSKTINVLSGPKKLLLLFDYSVEGQLQIKIYQPSGEVFTTAVTDERAELGLRAQLLLECVDRRFGVRLNNSNEAAWPTVMPVGYLPVTAESSWVDVATVTPPSVLRAQKMGVLGTQLFSKGTVHLYNGEIIVPLVPRELYPEATEDGIISGSRLFTGGVFIQQGEVAIGPSLTWVGPGKPAMLSRGTQFNNHAEGYLHALGPVYGAATVTGSVGVGDVLKSASAVQTTVALGAVSGDQVDRIDRSVVAATESLHLAKQVTASVLMGHDIVNAATEVEGAVVIGQNAGDNAQSVKDSVVIGHQTASSGDHRDAVVIGHRAGQDASLQNGTVVGARAALHTTTGAQGVVALGVDANTLAYDHSGAVGAGAQAPSAEYLQLGDHRTRVSVFGMETRADERDVGHREPTTLGLSFLRRLVVEQIQWAHRDSGVIEMPERPQPMRPMPVEPSLPVTDVAYQDTILAYTTDLNNWMNEKSQWDADMFIYAQRFREWLRQKRLVDALSSSDPGDHPKQLVITAQSIENALREEDSEVAMFTNHARRNGVDVFTRDDGQLLAAAVQGVLDLDKIVNSEAFIERIALKVLELSKDAAEG